MTMRYLAAAIVVATLTVVTVVFVRRLQRYSPLRRWVNVLIPGLQVAIMALLLACFILNDVPSLLYVLVVVAGVFCAVVDLALVRMLHASEEKELVDERERILAEQVALQAEHLARLESDASDALDAQREIASCLKSVSEALEDDARLSLRERLKIAASWSQPTERVCEHPAADALLQAKLRLCEENHITSDLALCVPADISVANVDICAVFSNVMDNAIAACRRVEPATERFVKAKARVQGGYFMLEVENSAPVEQEHPAQGERELAAESALGPSASGSSRRGLAEPFREHGWGTIILRAIAERYDGLLETGQEGGVFRTMVALKVAEGR